VLSFPVSFAAFVAGIIEQHINIKTAVIIETIFAITAPPLANKIRVEIAPKIKTNMNSFGNITRRNGPASDEGIVLKRDGAMIPA
jgi:hypothetical protein